MEMFGNVDYVYLQSKEHPKWNANLRQKHSGCSSRKKLKIKNFKNKINKITKKTSRKTDCRVGAQESPMEEGG